MPYQKIPKTLRPLYLKELSNNPMKRHNFHLESIKGYENSHYVLKNVSALELIFKAHNAYGHQGARLFWKNNLKTIQYHNPTLPIQVQRIECETKEDQLKCPAILKVTLNDGTTKAIDCKNAFHKEIMKELIAEVDAELVSL